MRAAMLRASVAFIICFAIIAAAGRVIAQNWLPASVGGASGGSIALITVEGVITAAGGGGGLLGGAAAASSVDICNRLYAALDDESIKGVLLRVNSPGGSAVGSDEIYQAIVALKAAGKPVVVSMGDLAASGGYYISSPASYIFANGATFTGSIGVIFQMLNWDELAAKVGLNEVTLTAGAHKDLGNPWRPMTDEERQILKTMLGDVHDQFIKAVDAGRQNLDEKQVRSLATGLVFTGHQAVANGLVDAIGGLHAAEVKVRELAHVDKDAPVEEYGIPSLIDQLLGVRSELGAARLRGGTLPAAAAQYLGLDPLQALTSGLYLNTTLRDLVVR